MASVLPISEVKRSVRVAASRVLIPRPSKSRTARVVLDSWAFIIERMRSKANIDHNGVIYIGENGFLKLSRAEGGDAEKLRFQVTMKMLTLDAILDLDKGKIKDKTGYGKFIPTRNFGPPIENNNQS